MNPVQAYVLILEVYDNQIFQQYGFILRRYMAIVGTTRPDMTSTIMHIIRVMYIK